MATSTVFLILFIVIAIVHVIGELLEEDKAVKVRTFTKPPLLLCILLYYVFGSIEAGNPINLLIAIGLFLGFVGDVSLLKPKVPALFLIGLGSFLIGHVLYIIAFIQALDGFAGVPAWVYSILIVFAGLFIVINRYLGDSTKDMKIPVILYMVIILTMSFCGFALMFSSITGDIKAPTYAFIGSVFFIISDFLLANQLFKKSFKRDQALIMITYLLAQFLIAQAYLG